MLKVLKIAKVLFVDKKGKKLVSLIKSGTIPDNLDNYQDLLQHIPDFNKDGKHNEQDLIYLATRS